MKMGIHIVTVGKHFPYLDYALRSICAKANGFSRVVISCPERDRAGLEGFLAVINEKYRGPIRFEPRYFNEWPNQGMLHHFLVILNADCILTDEDFILHMDSDHVFTQPVSPDSYLSDGKPDYVYASFDWLCAQQPNLKFWQEANQRALGVTDEFEFMRRAPIVHCREVYSLTREAIIQHTGMPLEKFMRLQRNEFPQSFAEFQALGSVAFRNLHGKYFWRRQEDDQKEELARREPYDSSRGWRPGNIYQAWSHRPPTPEDLAKWKELGLSDES